MKISYKKNHIITVDRNGRSTRWAPIRSRRRVRANQLRSNPVRNVRRRRRIRNSRQNQSPVVQNVPRRVLDTTRAERACRRSIQRREFLERLNERQSLQIQSRIRRQNEKQNILQQFAALASEIIIPSKSNDKIMDIEGILENLLSWK